MLIITILCIVLFLFLGFFAVIFAISNIIEKNFGNAIGFFIVALFLFCSIYFIHEMVVYKFGFVGFVRGTVFSERILDDGSVYPMEWEVEIPGGKKLVKIVGVEFKKGRGELEKYIIIPNDYKSSRLVSCSWLVVGATD
ncbi:MAG: hypothetical protein PHZ25_02260 [Candidatus Pacebacteria bacterium]|nr:hypothetical protein [Candidatus Paceibacterota bacterium]